MPPGPPDRNAALDFVKGVLILLMVVYHWGNYFLGNVPGFYETLRFLTPSFILITGAIIGTIYGTRYAADHSKAGKRLALRGAKLFIIFTVLNIGIHALELHRNRAGNVGLEGFFSNWFEVFVSGNSYLASFRVLLPIAYLLMISVAYLPLATSHHRFVVGGAVILSLALQLAEFAGWTSVNLFLLSFGLVGLAMEAVGFARINRASAHLAVAVLGYAVSLAAMLYLGPLYFLQLLEVGFSLLLIYGIGRRVSPENTPVRVVVLVGQYSLFAYVFQIAILQVLALAYKRLPADLAYPPLVLVAAIALTVLSVVLADRLRRVSTVGDRLYRLVFS